MKETWSGLGWTRDLPDVRDFTPQAPEIEDILEHSQPLKAAKRKLLTKVDLRAYCSVIEDQGRLGSCTANAGVGLMEYYQKRAFKKYLDGSRLFLYKATRNLLGWKGDQGAYLRTTMKAMVLFGIPPEEGWPYVISDFDNEPQAFLYSYAQNYKSIKYYRLDPPGIATDKVLQSVKRNLAAELPSMFGFSVYSSMPGIGEGADIPFPNSGDRLEGGHAIVAVGYDDSHKIGNDKGALLIRNSWGKAWGEAGYGWMPYRYVEEGLAVDFWSLVQAEFIDSDLFR
jgi:C1A family cysteine protease